MDSENTMVVGAEAIEKIRRMAVEAIKPSIVAIPDMPRGRHALWDGKNVTDYQCPTGAREAEAHSLRSFIDFTSAAISGKHGGKSPAVWVADGKLTTVLDDEDRRDRLDLILINSPQMVSMVSGELAKPRSQSDIIRFLRIDMAGTLPPDSKLLPLLRDMKFASASDGEANIQHGRESMGKKINATVLGTDAIPEEVTLSVQVFMTADITIRMDVRCAVDIYVQEQMFRIVPFPIQLQRAVDGTMDHIMERLSHLKCPVYMGAA